MSYYTKRFYSVSGEIFGIHCQCFNPVFVLAAVCLLLLPNAANSNDAQWTSIGPYGGNIGTLIIDPFRPDTLYAATNSNGIFKSTDGAANWMLVNRGLPEVSGMTYVDTFVMDPLHPEILYLASNSGIYKTVDGAAHWHRVDSGLPYLLDPFLWIDPITPFTLYVALHHDTYSFNVFDLYKTSNGGDTWDQVAIVSDLPDLPDLPDFITTNFTSAGNTSMGGSNPVYRSIDEDPWITVESEDIPLRSIDALAMDPEDPATVYAAVSIKATFTAPGEEKGIYKSTDSGAHWSLVNPGLPELKIRTLGITPVSPAILYAGTNGYGVLKSTDGGRNWTAASQGMTDVSECTISIDPVHAGTMYVGTGSGLFKTVDRGAVWTLITPEHAGPAQVCVQMDPLSPAVLYAVKNKRFLYKSSDGGQSWTAISTNLTGITWIYTLAIAPVIPATLYLAAETNGSAAGLFKSVDGGTVWATVDTDIPPDTIVRDIAIDPADPAIVYASISADYNYNLGPGIFKSADGGQTWRVVGEGMIGKIRIDPVTPANVYVETIIGGAVFKSGDGGGNWAVLGPPVLENDWTQLNGIEMDSANPSILYGEMLRGHRYKNISVSADGGKNWKLIRGQCENHYLWAADPFMPVVYAGGRYGPVALDSEPYLELPRLGAAVDAAGNPTETETAFSSGVSVNGGEFQREAVITLDAPVVVEGAIETDKKDIEKTADILAVIIYTPPSPQDNAVRQVFMFDGKNKLIPLDMTSYSISSLPAFQRDVALASFYTVKLFEGKFNRAGRMELYFGYRLNGEILVYNNTRPVDIQITP